MVKLWMNEPIVDRRIAFLDKSFGSWYDPEWFRKDKEMCDFIIKDIDDNDHYADGVSYSNHFKRVISPGMLSGGAKTLIMSMNVLDGMFPTGYLGNNCAHALHVLSDKYDVQYTYAGSIFVFEEGTTIKLMDTGEVFQVENSLRDLAKRGVLYESNKGIRIQID